MIPSSTIKINEAKPCSDPACHRKRHRLSGYCLNHAQRRHLYGHPRGRYVAPYEYRAELIEVRTFIQDHVEHPAIKAALEVIGAWVNKAWLGAAIDGHKDLHRLHANGVTPQDILITSAAVWLFSTRTVTLPDDDRLNYAMSIAVLALAPKERVASRDPKGFYKKRYSGESRRSLGRFLRTNLAPVFANIVAAIGKLETNAERQAKDLRIPFVTSGENNKQT